jgi:uncharacterized protein YndB with AHSA1/START domain
MARNERMIAAPPEAVFDVLADPRGYAYWVIGSREIRGASPDWPGRGSRFNHTVGFGPLRIKDHTVVEEVRPGRYLQLCARARPLGNARIKLELKPADGGTRVTMVEDPADVLTAFLFQPLTHLLTRGRNVASLDRLAELAEGRKPMPGDEPRAPVNTLHEGSVENPAMRERRARLRDASTAVRDGAIAGLVGAAAMSISTNLEMRLRGRRPSEAPAKALARVLGVSVNGERHKQLVGAAGHAATALSLGSALGLVERIMPGRRMQGVALFGLAMTPDAVVVPALGVTRPPWKWTRTEAGVSALHHAVFAAATTGAYSRLRRRGV